jgi:hypothetical protein
MKKIVSLVICAAFLMAAAVLSVSALVPVDCRTADEHPDYLGAYSIDGDETKFWHTNWEGDQAPLPISIYYDLGGEYTVSAVTILPRQDGNMNGLIYAFNVYVSNDDVNYTLAASTDAFEYDTVAQTLEFDPVNARYVQIEAIDTEGGFVSINEISFDAVEVAAAETEAPAAETEAPAAETEAPVEVTAPVVTTAPATFDAVLTVVAVALGAGVAAVSAKKRI